MLTVIKPFCNEFHRENRMDLILSEALATVETEYLLTAKELEACDLRGRKILLPSVCLKRGSIWNITGYWSFSDERQAA